MSNSETDQETVYMAANKSYSVKYHKTADCPMIRQNHNAATAKARTQVTPHHDPCQHPDCWGDREDRDEPSCPICGDELYGEAMPKHIIECSMGDSAGDDDE